MKLLQQPDSAAGEFEGRTAAEAVQLARQVLGEDAAVRCWKTRRGGVAGFFAKEAFVAGVTPPEGAVKRVKVSRPPRPGASRAKVEDAVEAAPTALGPEAIECAAESPTLSQLVEWTEDEVMLGADRAADDPFSEVLAEAQAAVNASRPFDGTPRPPATAFPLTQGLPPAPQAPPPPPPPPALPVGDAGITALRPGLLQMGVPAAYLPDDSACTYDELARKLSGLPSRAAPRHAGSVIVVVGARREVHATADSLLQSLGLKATDVIVVDPIDGDRQRVARRRSTKKVTVALLEASLRSRDVDAVAAWLDRLQPDYVLGAVSATAKRSDVESWRARLGQVDALALFGLAATATPGDLMGELPIAFLDGEEASTLRWMLALLTPMCEKSS